MIVKVLYMYYDTLVLHTRINNCLSHNIGSTYVRRVVTESYSLEAVATSTSGFTDRRLRTHGPRLRLRSDGQRSAAAAATRLAAGRRAADSAAFASRTTPPHQRQPRHH